MNVKERLRAFIKHKGISIRKFCETIGVSATYINSMRKSIQPDKLERIAIYYPDLNIQWLLTGEGEMLFSDIVEKKVLDNIISKYSETSIDELNDNSIIDLKIPISSASNLANQELSTFLIQQIADRDKKLEEKEKEINFLNRYIGKLETLLEQNGLDYTGIYENVKKGVV